MDEIPARIAITLKRALVWCGDQITMEQREDAWKWLDDNEEQYEEMGG
jgi:hypothetical protein